VIFIWGWRAVSLLLGTGFFHCPHCQADSEYKHLRSRRWFTVFFLPVIPLNKLGEHVLCQRCASTFRMAVLDYPTLGQLSHMSGLGGRALIGRLLALLGMERGFDHIAGQLVCEMPRVNAAAYGPDAVRRDVQGQQYLADPSRSAGSVNPLWSYAHVPHGYTGDATEAVIGQIERFAPGFP